METNTDDIKIIKNDASLYVNGRMQYQAVNLVTEYGAKLHGCKYAIASKHPQWKMEKRFEESLDQFRPYIFLTGKEYAAILESQQNDDKFHKRDVNNHDGFGFTDELTEIMHDCKKVNADPEPDVLSAIIEIEDARLMDRYKAALPEALMSLTEKQRSRFIMHVCYGKTLRDIAAKEGADVSSVRDSIRLAKENLKKYLKKI